MKNIQGFVVINEYVNNTPGEVAPLGELSTWSRTYSREQGEYQDAQVPGLQLVSMRCINEATQLSTTVSISQVREILEVVKACIFYAKSNTRPYDPIDFRAQILASFYSRIHSLVLGEFVDNGKIALPQYLSWVSSEEDNSEIKVWLSDESFFDQYSDYSITVVPPVPDVALLSGDYEKAKAAIEAQTPSITAQAVQEAKAGHPETYYRLYTFALYNRYNPSQSVLCHFPVLVYGKNGDNVDAIKDAIIEYISNHSTASTAAWEQILPDLYKRTEFVIIPRWDKTAVSNLTKVSGIYSSVIRANEAIAYASEKINFYTPAHVGQALTLLPHPYKCLMLSLVPGPNNILGKQRFDQLFADYLPIASTSADFSRMKVRTRAWIYFMDDLIMKAEKATRTTVLPETMRRTIRGGNLYISAGFDGVQYLVYAQSNNQTEAAV